MGRLIPRPVCVLPAKAGIHPATLSLWAFGPRNLMKNKTVLGGADIAFYVCAVQASVLQRIAAQT